ncbi:hypothetical protein QSI00_24465, partial [Escherichia coli]
VHVAFLLRFGELDLHLRAVVAVEAVAFDRDLLHAFAAEDVLEGARDGRGAGSRRAGNGDDGVTF